MLNNVIIYGAGSFARLARQYLDEVEGQEVVGYTCDSLFMPDVNRLDGLPVEDFESIDSKYPVEDFHMYVAAGYSSMRARTVMFNKAKQKGYKLVNFVHKHALVDETVSMGENNFIFPGVVIEKNSSLGSNNILWSSVNICHDVSIGSHCFVAAKSLVGGFSKVHDGCFLGFSSIILQNINLGAETLIGAGSLVLKNTNEFSKCVGTPAIIVGEHSKTGICIK